MLSGFKLYNDLSEFSHLPILWKNESSMSPLIQPIWRKEENTFYIQ